MFFFTVLMQIFLPSTTALAAARMIVELGKPQIYKGEAVLYMVTIENATTPVAPTLNGLDKFDVQPLGQQSSTQIINGRRTDSVQYRYALRPKESGVLHVPAPTAEVDGKILRGRDLTLQVIAPEKQGFAILSITSDRSKVYPTQIFTVTLNVQVKALPGALASRDPLTIQSTPPHLQVPWLVDEQLPEGLKPAVDWRRWIGPYQSRRPGGFAVNNLTRRSAFSLLDSEAVLFRPPPKLVERADEEGNQVRYWEYRFDRKFVGEKVGVYSFGPVTLKGVFASDVVSETRVSGKNIYAEAPAIDVEVVDVPEEGRPATYIGAIGTFKLTAELLPPKTRVGDPMTLTLALTGRGTLENTYAPDLNVVAAVAESFKIHEATQETTGDTRSFTYTIRPKTAEVTGFPAVPVSYFDVNNGRYVTVHSLPIPIDVSVAEELSGSDIVAASGAGSGPRPEVEARSEGIFANVTDPAVVRDQSVRFGRWLAALLALAGLYAVVAVASVQVQRLSADEVGRRRRGAIGRAQSRLASALEALARREARQGADQVQEAVTGLVADVAGVPAAGLTLRDVRAHLTAMDIETKLVDRVQQLLEQCDAAQYGSPDAVGQLGRDAKPILADLITALKTQKRFR